MRVVPTSNVTHTLIFSLISPTTHLIPLHLITRTKHKTLNLIPTNYEHARKLIKVIKMDKILIAGNGANSSINSGSCARGAPVGSELSEKEVGRLYTRSA